VGILATLASLVYSLLVLFERFSEPTFKTSTEWLRIGDISLTAGFEVNQLNALMLVIVSLVSFLVHTYSKGYMHGDERFSILCLFRTIYVCNAWARHLANPANLYFLGARRVGSFLLIGFYFYKEEASCGKKAFIMTRIGDVGLSSDDFYCSETKALNTVKF
jgi:NADH-quinone oxidoreductase subunit L